MQTQEVHLAYGREGLTARFPAEKLTVVTPRYVVGASDQIAEVTRAINTAKYGPTLHQRLVGKGIGKQSSVAISVCDGTRAQPRHIVIPALLEQLADTVDLANVTLLIATGTHRGNTPDELVEMFGQEVVDSVRIVNHDARDSSTLRYCGTAGANVPVWINSEWMDADFRITTGFVEPHFFAGFSGGPKMIAPGLAGLETVMVLHDARRIGDHRATWAHTVGNPVHDDIRAIAAATGSDFSLDVIMNRDHEIIEAFAGDLLDMHRAACERARELSMVPVPHRFDVVVTTNSGYPLDQNLYQAIKGLSAGATVVKPGGRLIVAAQCADGFPDHGSYVSVLRGAESPQELLAQIERRPETVPDQWQVQIQARLCVAANVGVHCDGLSDEELRSVHLTPVSDISSEVERALREAGPHASVCVLPEGPQTIPYVVEA